MDESGNETPVPRNQFVQEAVRSGLLLLGLVGAALLFAAVGAWVIAVIVALVAVAAVLSGAVIHPSQFATALHPSRTTRATAQVVYRRKQAWLTLETGTGPTLAVELRSRRLAHQMGQHPFPVDVLGDLEPGRRVVVQANRLTIWPVTKVSEMPPGVDTVDKLQRRANRNERPPDRPFG